jgi:uncharacterized protein YbjT (DUF2867 family)
MEYERAMLLITGASGTVGSQVVRALAAANVPFRVGTRDVQKLKGKSPGEPVHIDFDRPETLPPAFAGVDRLFLLPPFHPHMAEAMTSVIDAAKKAGVRHIVHLSTVLAGVEGDSAIARGHHAIGEHLRASGVAWTELRAGSFMQNFATSFAATIRDQGAFYAAWGTAKVATVDVVDIGDVAARVLQSPADFAGRALTLAPTALSGAEAAQGIARALGKAVNYVPVPPDAVRQTLLGFGLPSWAVEAVVELHAIYAAGRAARTSDDVERALGRPGRSFETFAAANAAAWR